MSIRLSEALALLLLVPACAVVDKVGEHVEPIPPVYAEAPETPLVPTGSIWRGDGRMMLAEDRRARHVGDILTILLVERVNAEKSTSQKSNRSSSRSVDVDGSSLLSALPGNLLSGGSTSTFNGSGATQQTNRLSGEITVIVREVLPNGALLVAGDRRIRITRGEEQMQLTGIVRPEDIDGGNRVPSTRVADARIRYTGTGEVAVQARQGWLSRFFDIVNPF